MIRCKPLLGTYVEIAIDDIDSAISLEEKHHAIDQAFLTIALVEKLMGFHSKDSELSKINARSHLEMINIHQWTYQVLLAAKRIFQISDGVFDCGVGSLLVDAGLLPLHQEIAIEQYGGLSDIQLIAPHSVRSQIPLLLDLGGIAKGFAVDKAVEMLQVHGITSGIVNAGGDLRTFGSKPKVIQVRSPHAPTQLLTIGSLKNGSIASTGAYFLDHLSTIVNPIPGEHVQFTESYSVIAPQCIYADALTKVLAITGNIHHPCFEQFSAQAIRVSA